MNATADQNLSESQSSLGGQFLTFYLGQEEFGLEILKVQEIIGVQEITPIPSTPPFIEGVINLRGKVIPVLDLRTKFGMEAIDQTQETCIIVVQNQDATMGVQVDKVSEVVDILEDAIEDVPTLDVGETDDFLLGIAKGEKDVKLLLDIDRVITAQGALEIGAQVAEDCVK